MATVTKEIMIGRSFHPSAEPYLLLLFDYPQHIRGLEEVPENRLVLLDTKPQHYSKHTFIVINDQGSQLEPFEDYMKVLFVNTPLSEKRIQYLESLNKFSRSLFYQELYHLYYTGSLINSEATVDVWSFYTNFFGEQDIKAILEFRALSTDNFLNSICWSFVRSFLKHKAGIFDKSVGYKRLIEKFESVKGPNFQRNLIRGLDQYQYYRDINKQYLFWIAQVISK